MKKQKHFEQATNPNHSQQNLAPSSTTPGRPGTVRAAAQRRRRQMRVRPGLSNGARSGAGAAGGTRPSPRMHIYIYILEYTMSIHVHQFPK